MGPVMRVVARLDLAKRLSQAELTDIVVKVTVGLNQWIEVEIKIPVDKDGLSSILRALAKAKARHVKSETHEDTYYQHPSRDFSKTDEALRVRRCVPTDSTGSTSTELTYKGPKLDSTTKTRVESTVSVDDSNRLDSILQSVGFREVATLKKKRAFYSVGTVTVSVDEVQDLGSFVEFETMVAGKDGVSSARTSLQSVIKQLGLDTTRSVRESYLELYLAHKSH